MPGGYLSVTEGTAGGPGLYDPGLSRDRGATVSVTLDGLEDAGLIVRREYGMVDLTPEGRRIAKKLYEKNVFFGRFLMAMGIEKEIARRDAMAVKNVLSDESFERLREFARERKFV